MTTPNDAALPVAHAEIDAKGDLWRIRIGGPDHHCTTPLYTATDYDKLREEVERLRGVVRSARRWHLEDAWRLGTGEQQFAWREQLAIYDDALNAQGESNG